MTKLILEQVTAENKPTATELLQAYGRYIYEDLKLMAGHDSFYNELGHFPGQQYLPPDGGFFIARLDGLAIGCAGFKRFNQDSCELKRMYIIPPYQGKGFGTVLTRSVLEKIKHSGYKNVLLDTNIEMPAAIQTYLKAGFVVIPPYCSNANANPVFLQLSFN